MINVLPLTVILIGSHGFVEVARQYRLNHGVHPIEQKPQFPCIFVGRSRQSHGTGSFKRRLKRPKVVMRLPFFVVHFGTIKMPNQAIRQEVFWINGGSSLQVWNCFSEIQRLAQSVNVDLAADTLPPPLIVFARGSWPQAARGHSQATAAVSLSNVPAGRSTREVMALTAAASGDDRSSGQASGLVTDAGFPTTSTTRLPVRPADDTLRQQIRYRRAPGRRPLDAGNP